MKTADTLDKKFSSDDDWELVYDWQCPACDLYCHQICMGESSGRLRLVNARSNPDVMKEITAQGFDIDQGMILKMNDQFYYGAEAMHELALVVSPSTAFKRLNYWVFCSRRRSERFYPVLRTCRKFLLKLLKRTKINNLGLPNNERF